jgi:GAF domain-containing protein
VADLATKALLQVARDVLSRLDVDEVLGRVLASAQALTGARYAALGVLDESGSKLARFLTVGIDEEEKSRIGPLPTGHGVLGELIRNPEPLRVADVGAHHRAYGFPSGHPPMRSFLGVPIFIGGRAYGNLYLTEKDDGAEFTGADEDAVVLLAEFAGLAIDHARRYATSEASRRSLERDLAALDATVTIARTLAGQTDLETILDLVAKRGRARDWHQPRPLRGVRPRSPRAQRGGWPGGSAHPSRPRLRSPRRRRPPEQRTRVLRRRRGTARGLRRQRRHRRGDRPAL